MKHIRAPAVSVCRDQGRGRDKADFRAEHIQEFDVGTRHARMHNIAAANRDAQAVNLAVSSISGQRLGAGSKHPIKPESDVHASRRRH